MLCGELRPKEIVHKIRQEKQKGKIGTLMGMSASQARLLSITARLTNNELSSQLLTNSKVRLASKSEEASDEYMDALSATKLTYQYYNDNGEAMNYNLTPSVIYSYEPLKSQYSIVDNNGVNLVSAQEAKNFEETDGLANFLKRYDLLEEVTTQQTVTKTKTNRTESPNPEWDVWNDKGEPDINDPKYVITPAKEGYHVYDWQYEQSEEMTDLYKMFEEASESCYKTAVGSERWYEESCYMHVLAHMLDLSIDQIGNAGAGYPKTFKTTIGESISIVERDINYSAINSARKTPYMVPISDIIRDGYDPKDGTPVQILYAYDHPSSDLDLSTAKEWEKLISDYYLPNIDLSAQPYDNDTKLKLLISNYQKDPSGNISKKNLYQKCADMLYLIKELDNLVPDNKNTSVIEYNAYYTDVLVPLIKTFQEDMQLSLQGINIVDKGYDVPGTDAVIDEEQHKKDVEEYYNEEPPKTIINEEVVEYEDTITITHQVVNDKDKAQWYTNLWYMMNGSESANVVTDDKDETTNGKFVVNGAEKKNPKTANYKVIDDITAKDSSWLQYALENGIVSLRQAKYFNPSEDSGKVPELESTGYMWKSVGFKNAIDIKEVEDTEKITRAQAKYEKATREIEAKDNEYDIQLKNLDTIHNALQTEYESVKNVISKNVERSFKAFS